ncbi:HDIG domain-containing protein, partial [bacterium]|nr:HDIG domain-containing protein [bacterium]
VEPITKTILPGQIIVREGDIVGENDIPALEAMGLYSSNLTVRTVLASCFMVLILIVIARQYLVFYLKNVYNNMRMLLGTALLCSVFMLISHYTVSVSPYLAPVAFTSVLISILIDAKLSILLVGLLAIYTGAMTSNLASSCMVITTGFISILSVQNVIRRWDIVTASLWIWAINVFTILVFSYNEQISLQESLFQALFFGALNGLLPALIASGALPLLEGIFKVTTHMRMLELSNPNEPALSDLLREAPGTYMHSIMVANLAEAAAKTIGADAMLCRAGACYHDIGKMKQPNMFVENQKGQENPHDKLPPTLSAMIIISHVSFGLELANKYKLPPDIVKFIREHHGTSMASFFYQKAKQQEDNEPVFVEDFSYPGPRPQSKETAIVMICDGIEAASRTLAVPNKENLQKLIDGMVNNIIKNKQLDECPISIKEINEVKASILHSLTNHYHSRIAYPSNKTVKK